VGLFSSFVSSVSSAVSSVASTVGAGLQSVVTGVGQVAAVAAPLLSLVPGPIGLVGALTGQLLGSGGQPIGLAGNAATVLAPPSVGPSAQAALFSGPAPSITPQTFGLSPGTPAFSAPFAAGNFGMFNAGSTARSGLATFAPSAALGSVPFGFSFGGAPALQQAFTGLFPSLASFIFTGRI